MQKRLLIGIAAIKDGVIIQQYEVMFLVTGEINPDLFISGNVDLAFG